MLYQIRRHTISFKNAFRGIGVAFSTQPNFRVHFIATLFAYIVSWKLKISIVEWAIITLTILWVFLAEMINTAIESMVDLITTEYREQARTAKDVAAGAVLMGVIGSIIIAGIIFLPKL